MYVCTEKAAIQEWLKEIEKLKKKVAELEEENKELKKLLHIKHK